MAKAAIVTGARGGIGRALVRAFEAAGHRVIGTDLPPGAESEPDPVAMMVDVDLRRVVKEPAYRAERVAALEAALGADPLSVLVHNAAVQILGSVSEIELEGWQETLDVNLTAPLLLSQALLPRLAAARGSILHIGSIHGRLTKPGFVSYATSKTALEGLTRAMAIDLGPAVRVNALAPAATATEMLEAGFVGRPEARAELDRMHPLGRIASPDEVARAAVFVASEGASFISGAVIAVDGGIGARLHDP